MKVSVCACEGYEKEQVQNALQELLAPLGGLCWVKPGMKIAVKANLVSMLKPEAAATTHPALLTALMKMLAETTQKKLNKLCFGYINSATVYFCFVSTDTTAF